MKHLYFILYVCVCVCLCVSVCVCAQDSESRSLLSPPVSSQCFPSDSRLGEEMGGEEQLAYRSEQCFFFFHPCELIMFKLACCHNHYTILLKNWHHSHGQQKWAMQRFQECHSLATHDSGWRKAMMLGGSLLPPETSKRERFLSFPRSTSPSEITTIEYYPCHYLFNCHHDHDLSQVVLSDLPLVAGPIYTRTRPVCLECLR